MRPEKTEGPFFVDEDLERSDLTSGTTREAVLQGLPLFTTIYPGWYPGRAVHIHFKVRTFSSDGAEALEFTSQLFFDDAVTDAVFAEAPYAARPGRDTRNEDDGIYGRDRSGSSCSCATVAPLGHT